MTIKSIHTKKINIVIGVLLVIIIFIGTILFSANVSFSKVVKKATTNNMSLLEFIDTFTPINHRQLTMSLSSNGIYEMRNNNSDDFNVLQLTDIHISGTDKNKETDIEAISTVYNLVSKTKPNLIVVTGDLISGTNTTSIENDMTALNAVFALMDKIGIPWIWTFGNHDHDVFDQYSSDEISELMSHSTTLYMYHNNDMISGYTNGVFNLCNSDGSINTALITLDSNSSIYEEGNPYASDYEGIQKDQVDWYANQIDSLSIQNGKKIDSLLFFHLPLGEYGTVITRYTNGYDDVTYCYGSVREKPCTASYNSGLFNTAVSLGSTTAMFCGHDHLNDYAVIYKGIELVYGKSIDYYTAYEGIEYETKQRGATLIRIKSNGNYTIFPIQYE